MPETTCCVPFCSRKGRHMFPKDKQRRDSWVQAIRRVKSKFEKWSPSKYSYVDLLGSTVNDFTILFIYYTNNANQNILTKCDKLVHVNLSISQL